MSLKVKIKADASQFDRTMSKTKKSVRGFGKSLMGMKSMLAGVAVAMGAAGPIVLAAGCTVWSI